MQSQHSTISASPHVPHGTTSGIPSGQPAWLALDAVQVRYAMRDRTVEAVSDLSLRLARGEIGCLLGPSGCGKTTVLRAIAGLVRIETGSITIGNTVVSGPGQHMAPEHRKVGVVFQDYALFPHLTIAENVGFGLKGGPGARLGLDRTAREERVAKWLERVGLGSQASHYPHQLSGGQQQRVALARALAPEPDLLLLDEPFSNLDVELRERLSNEVRSLLKASGITAVLVTHDQHEAFAMADQIGILNQGRLEQWDNAYNIYHRPTTRFVADFIGLGVFVPGEARPADADDSVDVQIELGRLKAHPCCCEGVDYSHRRSVDVLLRPDDVVPDDASPLKAEIVRKAFRGAEFLYTLRTPDGRDLLTLVPSHHDHAIGEKIGIRLEAEHVVMFPHGD